MAVAVDSKYSGGGMNFFSACLVVEELARVDPAVSVVCTSHYNHYVLLNIIIFDIKYHKWDINEY